MSHQAPLNIVEWLREKSWTVEGQPLLGADVVKFWEALPDTRKAAQVLRTSSGSRRWDRAIQVLKTKGLESYDKTLRTWNPMGRGVASRAGSGRPASAAWISLIKYVRQETRRPEDGCPGLGGRKLQRRSSYSARSRGPRQVIMKGKDNRWTYKFDRWVHEEGHEVTQEGERYGWYADGGMGPSGFAETLETAQTAAIESSRRGEPGWMSVCAQPGEDIEPDQANAWTDDFVDCFGDTDGCSSYTLWPDGAVTLAHPESDTYKVWRKKAGA